MCKKCSKPHETLSQYCVCFWVSMTIFIFIFAINETIFKDDMQLKKKNE